MSDVHAPGTPDSPARTDAGEVTAPTALDDLRTGSAAADDPGDPTPVTGGATGSPASWRWRRIASTAAVALISVVALVFWRGFHLPGHDSGDDFALYIDQARSLLQGDVGATLGRTRFAVDNSGWQTFSPYAYPWGLPLLLAPVLALTGVVDPETGIDYAPLKMTISVTFLIALLAYHSWLRRRIHWLGAALLPVFLGTNIVFVLHTDNVLSELPFLMSLMLIVVWFDRVRERGLLLSGSVWPLVVLGLLVAFSFNIRREGLGALLGVGLGQLVAIWPERSGRSTWSALGEVDWRRAAVPWATFAAAVVAFQIALPSEVLPKYSERDPAATTGLGRIPGNIEIYRPMLAEQLGLKDFGPVDTTLFGSPALGAAAMITLVVLAVLGLVTAAVRDPARELVVVGMFVGVSVLVLSAPFQTYRYIMALVPFFLYFVHLGVATPIAAVGGRGLRRPTIVAELLIASMIVAGWGDTINAREFREGWAGPPRSGPQEPAALEMFEAVRETTRGDSVIVYHRARTMMLYTHRQAVQGGALDFAERGGGYYVMYLEPDGRPGDYSQYPLTDAEAAERGFTEIWRNDGWVIWRTPYSRAPERVAAP